MSNPQPLKFLGIPGSLRRDSYNLALLRTAEELLPPHITLDIFTLHDIPMYNSDVEREATPEPVIAFREAIKAADALIISTPEYNYSIPGVLKNGIDWGSRRAEDTVSPLFQKPIAIMGAGGRLGTALAQRHLRDILLHEQAPLVLYPQVMVAGAWQEFDENGHLNNDRYRQQISNLLTALAQLAYQQQSLTNNS
ncbi:MAG TPA: NAD(P)H-dependent oxidoreductase [Anaerolineae bacterium]|nr:NAD(P)H-dependent oxidoreductase [Anaerolineae bacterium]